MAVECKGIAGNIGVVKARVEIYSHNPFWARPHQYVAFPFTRQAGAELGNSTEKPNIDFDWGNACLRPLDKVWSNFVAVENAGKLDISRGLEDNPTIKSFFPTGEIYENSKNETIQIDREDKSPSQIGTYYKQFKQFLWLQEKSSAFYNTVTYPPSQYGTPVAVTALDGITLENKETSDDYFKKAARAILSSGSATWDMNSKPDPTTNTNYVYPVMVSRRTCSDFTPIHWTLRKFIPLYQGEDFSINFTIPDKALDDFPMKEKTPQSELYENRMRKDYTNFFDPYPFTVANNSGDFEYGISNSAFAVPPPPPPENGQTLKEKDIVNLNNTHIGKYYLKNKSYIIIELGNGSNIWPGTAHEKTITHRAIGHNYFIELINGHEPRFLCWGKEVRGFDGKSPYGIDGNAQTVLTKLRVLSTFPISVADLFQKGEFKITVRNYLGDIIILFSGIEAPWRISRADMFESNGNIIEERVPMVVEKETLRIHGGNMTLGISFGPLIFPHTGYVKFKNREAEVFQANNKDVYATFAHPGDNDSLTSSINTRSKSGGLFTDPQFRNLKMGYDVDAFYVTEIHKNKKKTIPVYQLFRNNYVLYGREWATFRLLDNQSDGFLSAEENPSALSVFVESNSNVSQTFDLSGLPESYMGENGKYVGQWNVGIGFSAGSVLLNAESGTGINEIDFWTNEKLYNKKFVLAHCVTPIATAWSLIVLGGGKVITKEMTEDITEFVTSIIDGWQAEDYSSINHETKLKLYLPVGIGNKTVEDKISRIISLLDKTCYFTISYWWDHGMGLDHSVQDGHLYNKNRPETDTDDPRLIQMTGLGYGADVERSANRVTMSISVKDYMEPLRHQYVFNCPFFDSVSDTSAIFELMKMAGFDNSVVTDNSVPGQQRSKGIDRRSLGFLQQLQNSRSSSLAQPIIYNEEKHVHLQFALPGTYASLNNPTLKFSNGTPYKDVIAKLAKFAGKTFYFDRYGVFIVEMSPAKLAAFKRTQVDQTSPDSPLFDIDIQKLIKAAFVTTPRTKIYDPEQQKMVAFDPKKHTPYLVYNTVKFKRNVSEAINHIIIWAAQAPDPVKPKNNPGWIIKGAKFFDQMWDPEAEGFFGYSKPMYQANGVFGDGRSVDSAMSFYARFKFPPIQVSFECYGVPGLKPLDIIMLDSQPLYITEINHELDPSTNSWWMTVSAEWLKIYDQKMLFPPVDETDITRPDI